MSGDADKEGGMDSSGQEIIQTDQNDFTHPAVATVFRTDNILEEICSYLDFNALKQFRLVSRVCSDEGRRELIKRDQHWVVVESTNNDWQLELGHVLTNLEKATSEVGENRNKKLLGWIFRRLELEDWKHCFGSPYFLQQWGHSLRKIHLEADDEGSNNINSSHFIITIHNLLTVWCPNLEEMVVYADNLNYQDLSLLLIDQVESLDFPSLLLKLKCLRVKNLHVADYTIEDMELLQRFITKLVRAAGTALETLEIEYPHPPFGVERRMLESLSLNVGVNNFQSLQEITLIFADNVAILSHLVKKCFPKLTKLILGSFYNSVTGNRGIRSEAFPALKSLIINYVKYEDIITGRIVYFLQHLPNLEVLAITSSEGGITELPQIPNPIAPLLRSLRSFTLITEDYDLRLLVCAVDMFPNLVKLDLLGFGRDEALIPLPGEPEYSFGELIDIISPLNSLQHFYVNHAFHTSTQLVDAIQLTANLTALRTFVLSQAAHDYTEQDFNVSFYLTSSDPDFQYILDCDYVKRLMSAQLSSFRFGTTQEEVEEEAAAKGGHVSFGKICPCYREPWMFGTESHLKPCPNS